MILPHLTRRKVAQLIAITSLLPALAPGEAVAWVHGLSATSFNGGKSQVNPNFLYNSGEYAFLNSFKTSDPGWSGVSGINSPVTPAMLDTNGYPTTLTNDYGVTFSSGIQTTFFLPPQTGAGSRPGWYVIAWDGNGSLTTTGMTTSSPATTSFTASIASNVMVVSSSPSNTIYKGMPLSVGGYVGNQISGTTGGIGSYSTIGAPNTASQTISATAGSLTSTTGSGRCILNTANVQWFLGIATIGSPYITNIRVYHVDDEANYVAGGVYGTQFVLRLVQGNFGTIRFLNWEGSIKGENGSNQTNWFTRKPQSYAWYSGFEMRSSLYTGLTTQGSSGAYTASAPSINSATGAAWSGSLVDKTTVTVCWDHSGSTGITNAVSSGSQTVLTINTGAHDASGFTIGESVAINNVTGGTWAGLNTTTTVGATGAGTITVNIDSSGFTGTPVFNSGAPSFTPSALFHSSFNLNVGGTGVIPILGTDCGPITPASNRSPIAGTFQSIATLVYDAVLNSWIKNGGDAASSSVGLNAGAPPELMVSLCAQIRANPWFVTPTYCCTPVTDFLPNLLWYIKQSAPSWMSPWIEGPNELWNPAFTLPLGYAQATAIDYGWGSGDFQNWYGKVASTLGQVCKQVLTNYRMVCAVQTGTGTSPGGTASSNPRLSSTKYVNNVGGLQTPQAPLSGVWGTITFSASVGVAEAWRWVTHGCCANYYSPGLYGSTLGTPNEAALATAFAGGDNTAPTTYANSVYVANSVVTFTVGTPGIVNWAGHPFVGGSNEYVCFMTTGTGPTGVSTVSSAVYVVNTVLNSGQFTISLTAGGSQINMSGSSTGTWTGYASFDPFSLPMVLALHQNWKTFFQGFGVQKMCFYEGDYSPDYDPSGTSQVDLLRAASKLVATMPNDPLGMQGATTTNYNNCTSLSGGGFVAEFPSLFQLGGKNPSNNAWSALENIYITPDPPHWLAIEAYNQ